MRFIYTILFLILFLPATVMAGPSYKQADSRAYHAPSRFDGDIDGLIAYLIKPFQKNEMMRARVIFAWIVYHIQYNNYEYKTGYEKRSGQKGWAPPEETFTKRTGVCRDNAALFDYMAKKANLETHLIIGDTNYGLHAWNAVKINGKWELLDTTWAVNGQRAFRNIKNDRKYKLEMQRRTQNSSKNNQKNMKQINNKWFMTQPKEMIKTHKPNDPKWSFLNNRPDKNKSNRK